MQEIFAANENPSQIKWLFLDLNSYFASVEQQENPALRGKPMAVVPMMTDGTCAIAASYEAKKYGIRTGTKIHDAKRMCPDLQLVLARHDKYVQYHEKILDEVLLHTPINKVWSIDELSSKLPPNKCNREAATALAQRIREGIWKNIGVAINCSIGFAPNGYLAKVATNMMKPNGLVFLEKDQLPGPLFDLSLRDFPGIGANMEVNLRERGITTTEQFWNLSPKQARKIWGSVEGEKFWYNLHGYEIPSAAETNRTTIGHSRILEPELRAPAIAKLVARRLTVKAAARLRRYNLYSSCFEVSFRTVDQQGWGASMKITHSQDNFAFLKALDELWSALMATYKPGLLKKVSINMLGLSEQGKITGDLFDFASPARQTEQKKNAKLSGALDHLNKRFGQETVTIGVSPQTQAGFVGTKIAFSRIPDVEEFYE